jgi:hypothetical protein
MRNLERLFYKIRFGIYLGLSIFGFSQVMACGTCGKENATEQYQSYFSGIDFEIREADIVGRNLQKEFRNDETRNCFKRMVVQMGVCHSESDVDFYDNDTVKINMKCQCSNHKDPMMQQRIQNCKDTCNSLAAMLGPGICWNMPNKACAVACAAAVETARRTCEWCCSRGSFMNDCVYPLRVFVAPVCYM